MGRLVLTPSNLDISLADSPAVLAHGEDNGLGWELGCGSKTSSLVSHNHGEPQANIQRRKLSTPELSGPQPGGERGDTFSSLQSVPSIFFFIKNFLINAMWTV